MFMLQPSRILLIDSFRWAKNELSTSFLKHHTISERNIRKEVQRYLSQPPKGHTYRSSTRLNASSNQRSWFRQRLSLILEETKKSKNWVAAEEALKCALKSPEVLKFCDFNWVKNAFLSCRTLDEWEKLKEGVQKEHMGVSRLSPSSSSASTIQDQLLASMMEVEAIAAPSALQSSSCALPRADSSADMEERAEGQEEKMVKRKAHRRREDAKNGSFLDSDHAGLSNDPYAVCQGDNSTTFNGPQGSIRSSSLQILSSSPLPSAALHALEAPHASAGVVSFPHPAFFPYFIRQGLVKNEVELMALVSAIRSRPKRLTFRIHGSSGLGSAAKLLVQSTQNGDCNAGIHYLSFLPASFAAYTMDCSPGIPYPQLLAHRRLLHHLTHDGLASYQSLSSMLAVYFLHPQPGERILDACASPGSKTSLILDVIDAYQKPVQNASPDSSDVGPGTRRYRTAIQREEENEESKTRMTHGLVIANDVSFSRATILEERFKERHVSFPSFGVVEGDFEDWGPNRERKSTTTMRGDTRRGDVAENVTFDKVLVDAPCTGESRLGRDNGLSPWRLWHPSRGLDFFPKQVALLRRAVECARCSGGRILYTTCTFNPIENEAVVAAILREYSGVVRLVPLPSVKKGKLFSTFHKRKGKEEGGSEEEEEVPVVLSPALSHWYVPARNGLLHATYKEAIQSYPHETPPFPREAFAFSDEEREAEEVRTKRANRKEEDHKDRQSHASHQSPSLSSSLHRSVRYSIHRYAKRLWPHLNDGGEGFFFALLEVYGGGKEAALTDSVASAGGEKSRPFHSVEQGGPPTSSSSFLYSMREVGKRTTWGEYQLLSLQHESIQDGLLPLFWDAASVLRSFSTPFSTLITTEAFQRMSSTLSTRNWAALQHKERGVIIASNALLQSIPCEDSLSTKDRIFAERKRKETTSNFFSRSCRLRSLGVSVLTSTANHEHRFPRQSFFTSHPHRYTHPHVQLTDEGAFWVRNQLLVSSPASPFLIDLPLQMIEMLLSQQELSVAFYAPYSSSHRTASSPLSGVEGGFSPLSRDELTEKSLHNTNSVFFLSLPSSHTADIERHYPCLRTENSLARRFKFSSPHQLQKWEALFTCLRPISPPHFVQGKRREQCESRGSESRSRAMKSTHGQEEERTERTARVFNAVVGVAGSTVKVSTSDYLSPLDRSHRHKSSRMDSTMLPTALEDVVQDWAFPVQVRSAEQVAGGEHAGHGIPPPGMVKTCYIQLVSSSAMRNRYIAMLGKLHRCFRNKYFIDNPLGTPSMQENFSHSHLSSPALYGVVNESPYTSSSTF